MPYALHRFLDRMRDRFQGRDDHLARGLDVPADIGNAFDLAPSVIPPIVLPPVEPGAKGSGQPVQPQNALGTAYRSEVQPDGAIIDEEFQEGTGWVEVATTPAPQTDIGSAIRVENFPGLGVVGKTFQPDEGGWIDTGFTPEDVDPSDDPTADVDDTTSDDAADTVRTLSYERPSSGLPLSTLLLVGGGIAVALLMAKKKPRRRRSTTRRTRR